MTGGDSTTARLARNAAKLFLGQIMESRLSGTVTAGGIVLPDPWDAWWACYRAGLPLSAVAAPVTFSAAGCPACTARALQLAGEQPPAHPDQHRAGHDDTCLTRWATRIRTSGPALRWPPLSLTAALIKPGAPAPRITTALALHFELLREQETTLTPDEIRHLYPEAYGADFVNAVATYLTSGPVRILILHARPGPPPPAGLKTRIRSELGGTDMMRNHLHMPDNPGEALADIALFAGPGELADLYRRHDSGSSAERMAFYRAALGTRAARADSTRP